MYEGNNQNFILLPSSTTSQRIQKDYKWQKIYFFILDETYSSIVQEMNASENEAFETTTPPS